MTDAMEVAQVGRRRRPIGSRVVATGALVGALLAAPVGGGAPADSTWKTHHDQNCGIELKYPASYTLEASGAADHCDLWVRIGVKGARGLRALYILEMGEPEGADREARRPRTPSAVRDVALHLATTRCDADGAGSTTYCIGGEVRSSFTFWELWHIAQ